MIFYESKEAPGVRVGPEESQAIHEGGGCAPYLVDDSETPPDVRPTPKIPINT